MRLHSITFSKCLQYCGPMRIAQGPLQSAKRNNSTSAHVNVAMRPWNKLHNFAFWRTKYFRQKRTDASKSCKSQVVRITHQEHHCLLPVIDTFTILLSHQATSTSKGKQKGCLDDSPIHPTAPLRSDTFQKNFSAAQPTSARANAFSSTVKSFRNNCSRLICGSL